MASVYKPKGTKYWWGRIQRDGRVRRRSLKTTARAVAEKRLRAWAEELDATAWGEEPARTYDEAMLHFQTSHVPTLKPQSQRRYRVSARMMHPFFTGLELPKLRQAEMAAYETARRASGASAPTIRRDLACLSSMFEAVIVDWDLEIPNPVGPFLKKRRRRGLKESPPRTRYLSHADELALLAAAPDDLAQMIVFAIDTGLRLEEQLSLTRQQIDWQRREVAVTVTKTGIARWVPLLPRAFEMLRAMPPRIDTPYVFCRPDGRRYGKRNKGLAGAAGRAGITDLTWHDLRRTCGCRLLQDHGLKMKHVSEWLGHSSVAQTERAYAFLEVDQLHEAVGTDIETVIGSADS